jgi:hypothetical protein
MSCERVLGSDGVVRCYEKVKEVRASSIASDLDMAAEGSEQSRRHARML